MDVGVVVLTQGTRPAELTRAVESVLAQHGVHVDVVVVGNAWSPTGLPPGVRAVHLPDNVGIPAGRAAGVPCVGGPFLLFLDDDAALPTPDFLARALRCFALEPRLGVLQPRPVDPQTGETPRRFVPRLRVGDPARSSWLSALWEGALVVRREAYEAAGGWAPEYFYAHEGVELAWRLWDAGWQVRYDGQLTVWHDAVLPTRHPDFYRMQARNRIWLARRNLPWPVGVAYVLTWVLLTLVRARSWEPLRESSRGWVQGCRLPCGVRRPISWRAVWRMARAGRPPVI